MNIYDEIKSIESQYDYRIPDDHHLIVRIDGHKFSKFTKQFKKEKPFCDIIADSMIEVTKKLMERFGAYTVYTQSDEITLVFPSLSGLSDGWTHIYSGRIQKISSLLAGFSSSMFVNELFKRSGKMYDVYFDARVFATKSDVELCKSVLCRIKDGIRNSKQSFAYFYAGHKKLLHKKADEQIEYVAKEFGKQWEIIDNKFKYGVLVKKKKYLKENNVVRSQIIELVDIIPEINCHEKKYIELIKAKYYES